MDGAPSDSIGPNKPVWIRGWVPLKVISDAPQSPCITYKAIQVSIDDDKLDSFNFITN